MSYGLWIGPAVLAGLFVILRAAIWLERLAPAAFEPVLPTPDGVDTGFAELDRHRTGENDGG
jgi:hypothetical protein